MMKTHRFAVLGVTLFASACGSKTAAPSGGDNATSPAVIPPAATPPAVAAPARDVKAGSNMLVIANDTGVHRYSTDGTKQRTLTPTPARWPRLLDNGDVLFLDPDKKNTRTLRVVDTAGKVRIIAKLPRGYSIKDCVFLEATRADSGGLAPQSGFDVVVDRKANTACLKLLDRNENMASLAIAVGVDLATGKVDKWLIMDGNKDCDVAKRPAAGLGLRKGTKNFACSGVAESRSKPPASTATYPFSFDEKRQTIVGAGRSVALGTSQDEAFSAANTSPSGRWIMLSGCTQGADYFHSLVLMFDRADGKLYPVAVGPWPAALDAKQVAAIGACETKTLAVVGETPTWWVGHKDDLVIGNTVVLPGVKAWKFDGHAAP